MAAVAPGRRSPIARELMAIGLIVSCFAVGVTVFEWVVRARVESITEDALASVQAVDRMRLDLHRSVLLLQAHYHDTDSRHTGSVQKELARLDEDFETTARRYAPLVTFPGEAQAWAEFQEGAAECRNGFPGVLALCNENRDREAQSMLDRVSRRLEAVDVTGERLAVINADAAGALASEVRKTLLWTNLTVVTLTLVVIALVLIIGTRELRSRLSSNERLEHANRLATVGQLAAGVAHELGSPLQVVSGRAKMMATGEALEGEAREAGRIILEQAQRMTQIIRGLLDFARRRPSQPSVLSVDLIAQETVRVLAPAARKKAVTLQVDAAFPVEVRADRVQIQQALTNLVMNAIQAVAEGGHVTVLVRRERASPPVDHGGAAAEYISLSVKDDGPGISEQHQSRLFEPFFTTKDVGEGTGLGLAIAQGLVRENGGWVTAESSLGHGARFSIFLPDLRRAPEPA